MDDEGFCAQKRVSISIHERDGGEKGATEVDLETSCNCGWN